MNETMNVGLSPEGNKKKQEQEYDERCADHLARHPEPLILKENLREAELEKKE